MAMNEVIREDVEKGVRRALKDPTSALFDDLTAGRTADGAIRVCGYVNSKNSFGGYVGRTPFYGDFVAGRFVVSVIPQPGSFEHAGVMAVCSQSGIPLPA